ncbi:DsbA family protein [Actinomyces vulturis]|uniref:DsbA family protein n=1 Tax=Actinomyces vulturis TaxID=1857645 RepID=UPI0008335BD6|nr:thioredoxin domain-containing protein [Actinomyces vulturis]
MSTASNRDAARAKAKAMREEQARAARKKSILIIVAATVITALVIAAVIFGSKSSNGATPTGETPSVSPSTVAGIPPHTTENGAIPFGKDLVAGSVNENAPVIDLYFDYACPHCAEFETLHSAELAELATNGQATIVLHPVKILGSAWTDAVNNALAVVLVKDPAHAMDFHKNAFAILENAVKTQNPQALTIQALIEAATNAGVPTEVSTEFTPTIEANTYQPWTTENTKHFQEIGLTGTPSLLINGQKVDLAEINTPTGITDKINSLK